MTKLAVETLVVLTGLGPSITTTSRDDFAFCIELEPGIGFLAIDSTGFFDILLTRDFRADAFVDPTVKTGFGLLMTCNDCCGTFGGGICGAVCRGADRG